MSVRIITDSTADVRPALAEQIPFVSLMIRFGDNEYTDGVTMSRKEFYEQLAVCTDLPTTSQPTPPSFEAQYKEAADAGDQVIVITISSKLSGTFQSANIAAMDYDDVFVVDSENATIGAGILAERAKQLADSGMSAQEIVDVLNKEKKEICLVAALDTLEYLKRGGRLSKAAAFAGSMLNIKPLITVADGEIKVIGKARGTKQANTMLNKEVEKAGVDFTRPVMAGYTGTSDELLQGYLAGSGDLFAALPNGLDKACVSGTIGTHVGPGAYTVAFFKK